MPINIQLSEATPYRLVYFIEIVVAPGVGVVNGFITNNGLVTPDLRVDSAIWAGSPIYNLVRSGVLTTAQARRVLNGDGLISVADLDIVRAHLKITPFNIGTFTNSNAWSVDAAEGSTVDPASAGFPVVIFTGPQDDTVRAFIDIDVQHSMDR